MCHSLLRKSVGLLGLASVFLTCTDHRVDPLSGQRNRLKQEILAYQGGRIFYTLVFEYDQQNRVSAATYNFPHSNPGSGDTIQADRGTFTYDGQNRVLRYDYRVDQHLFCCTKPLVYGERTDVTYDAAGQTATTIRSQALSDFGDFKPVEKRRLVFGTGNQVIKETLVGIDDNSEYPITYTYANGNIIDIQAPNSRSIFEYDNAPNPDYGLSPNPAIFGSNQYSRNNIIKQTTIVLRINSSVLNDTITTTYSRAYNEKGLLVKSVSTTTPVSRISGFSPNTVYYVYETY